MRHLSPVAMLVLLLVVILAFRDPVGVALTVGSVAFSRARRASAAWAGGARSSPSPPRRCRSSCSPRAAPTPCTCSGATTSCARDARRPTPSSSRCASSGRRWPSPPAPPRSASTRSSPPTCGPMRSFGIACGTGVLLCWLTSLTLVPAVVALWPRKAQKEVQLARLGDALVRAVALGAAPPSPPVRRRARRSARSPSGRCCASRVRMEPRAFFRVGSEPWLAERFLDEHFGGATFAQIWLLGRLRRSVDAARGGAPGRLRALAARRAARCSRC